MWWRFIWDTERFSWNKSTDFGGSVLGQTLKINLRVLMMVNGGGGVPTKPYKCSEIAVHNFKGKSMIRIGGEVRVISVQSDILIRV